MEKLNEKLDIPTRRGTVLNGVLFSTPGADTVVIAITGIHGNFYSNPFYYNIGDTLNEGGVDFIYAQTNDAFGEIRTFNVKEGKPELIGSWNEDFNNTDEDIEGYLDFAEGAGYKHVILAGHSLGANKENKLIFLEGTGHTYQRKEQELADDILKLVKEWTKG